MKTESKKIKTVAIIDDDEVLSKNIFKVLLERQGFRVITANDGEKGIKILQSEVRPPDLIFVDCSMPDMDGATFLVELKSRLPRIYFTSKILPRLIMLLGSNANLIACK
jgi:response regulator RpfG family c-di-GMP phosphodiesterase